jgi:hypothetical protein
MGLYQSSVGLSPESKPTGELSMSDKIMSIQLNDNTLPDNTLLQVFHANPDTGLVCLNDIYELGNQVRILRGEKKKSLKDFIRSKSTVEFLIALEGVENQTVGNSHLLEIDEKGRIVNMDSMNLKYFKTENGVNGKTWVHPLVALEALGRLDARVRVLAYKQLYELSILGNRLESANSFNKLNAAYKEAQEGRSVFQFDYTHLANAVADKVGMLKKTGKGMNRWNSATPEQLAMRSLIQDHIIFLLETKQVKTRLEILKAISEMEDFTL